MTLSITTFYIECYYAECHLCKKPFLLSVANKPFMLGVVFAECRFAARETFSEHASLFTFGRLLVQKMFVIFCTEDAVKPRFIVGFRIRLVFREKMLFHSGGKCNTIIYLSESYSNILSQKKLL